jgi:phosphoesterase RecJ-like protein
MTYRILPGREEAVKAVLDAIEGAQRVILTTHINADGDGSGCEIALLSLLQESGKEGWILNPTPFPELFFPFLSDPARLLDPEDAETATRCREADLLLVVDTGVRERIGKVAPLVEHLPTVVIDHHPVGDDALSPGVTFIDTSASAAGELVFDLLWARGGPWTQPIVDGLYIAIFSDTGGFRFSNARPGALRAAAELVERGASPDELAQLVHGRTPLRRIRLLERSLPTLEVSPDGRVGWMSVPADAFQELGCKATDLDGMVDIPREIEGVDVGILFREIEPRRVKISLRSNRVVDVNAVAREFGGGGHIRASGALVEGEPIETLRERVVERTMAAATAAFAGEAEAAPPHPSSEL